MMENNIKNVLKDTIIKKKKLYKKYFPCILLDKSLEIILNGKINYMIKPFLTEIKIKKTEESVKKDFINISSIMDISFSQRNETTLHYSQFNCFSNLSMTKIKNQDRIDKTKSFLGIQSMEKITLKKDENLEKESRRKIVEKIINEGEIYDIYNPIFSSLEENLSENLEIKKNEILKNSNLNSKKKRKKTVRKIKKKSGLKKKYVKTVLSNNFNKNLYNTNFHYSSKKVFPISEKKYK